jgi:NAD(P)H-dependent FMN reductase
MPLLEVIVASTRDQRVGRIIADWFVAHARAHGSFDVELLDLRELALPLLDEPHHPRFKRYEHAHTKAWSAIVDRADAFVFVTPEYNYGCPPALVNAIDYLWAEWQYKPLGFVSYGGISGGTRSAQMTKLIATTVKLIPIPEAVTIPLVAQHIKDGAFDSTDKHTGSIAPMLVELRRWTDALAGLRHQGSGVKP